MWTRLARPIQGLKVNVLAACDHKRKHPVAVGRHVGQRAFATLICIALAQGAPAVHLDNSRSRVIPEHLEMEGPFTDPSEVIDTCLVCHEDTATEVMLTTHWTWSDKKQIPGRGSVATGKLHAVSSYCYGIASNLGACTACHIGYGWTDDRFDFSEPTNVDCLVCHDTTDTYQRAKGGGDQVDLERIAQQVANPRRANCGGCHFRAGIPHILTHGDLNATLIDPSPDIDVHMTTIGLNFSCQSCHVTRQHKIPGMSMTTSPASLERVECTDCHPTPLHKLALLDHHAKTVACQTCHIPRYARSTKTTLALDWSEAGKKKAPEFDADGLPIYLPELGRLEWGRNLIPHYAWFNGFSDIYNWGERVDPREPIELNRPIGGKGDNQAKISPFQRHRGRQLFDRKYRYLINPTLAGQRGFATTKNWDSAARNGMQARGLAYSGRYGFVDTLMYTRINHMVAPAAKSLTCRDCHGRKEQRMPWRRLGYNGDPLYVAGQSRYPIIK